MKSKAKVYIEVICLLLLFAGQGIALTEATDIVPDAELISDKEISDVGEEILFTIIENSFNIYCCYINFHDGTELIKLSNSSIIHKFLMEGIYEVTLISVSTAGLTQNVNCKVKVQNYAPKIDFILPTPLYQEEYGTFMVKNMSNADSKVDLASLKYLWHFGDGETSEGPVVSHKYNMSGNYEVTLFAIDDQGAVASIESPINVLNRDPIAIFDVSNLTPFIDEMVFFNATSSTDSSTDLRNLKFLWDFGDGFLDEGAYVSHTYTKVGSYTAILTLMDNDMDIGAAYKDITVYNHAQTIDSYSPDESIEEGDTISYGVNVSDDLSDLPTMEYIWDNSGNGSISTQRYGDNGVFTNNLIVKDSASEEVEQMFTTEVENSNPIIQVDGVYLEGNIIVKIEGNMKNTGIAVRYFINGEEQLTDIIIPFNFHCDHHGCGCTCWCGKHNQYVKIPVSFDASDDVRFDIFYFNFNGTNPICENIDEYNMIKSQFPKNDTLDYINLGPVGHVCDVSLAKFYFVFSNGANYDLHHVFRTYCEGTWNWSINPRDYLSSSQWTIKGKVYDRGQDDLNLTVLYYANYTETEELLNSFTFSSAFQNQTQKIVGELPFSITIFPEISNFLTFSAVDDDGGTSEIIINVCGQLKEEFRNCSRYEFKYYWYMRLFHFFDRCRFIHNIYHWRYRNLYEMPYLEILSPKSQSFSIPDLIYEESQIALTYSAISQYSYGIEDFNTTIDYYWNFGDGVSISTNETTVYHSWDHPGDYLVQVEASDGKLKSIEYRLIEVKNEPLYPSIDSYDLSGTVEGHYSNLTALVSGTNSELSSYLYLWNFGDGTTATGKNCLHIWNTAGIYILILKVIDPEGFVEIDEMSVTVLEFKPELFGPFCFDGWEGSSIKLSVDFIDNIADYDQLHFLWNIGGQQFTGSNPTFYGIPGSYTGTVMIYDLDGNCNYYDIKIDIRNHEPELFSNSSKLYGSLQPLELRAYAIDFNLESKPLSYKWFIDGNKIGDGQNLNWTPTDGSKIYYGTVTANDGYEITKSSNFYLGVSIDSDGDGIIDELEQSSGMNETDSDSDGDYLSDLYETEISKTNPTNPDSDRDGLYDGCNSNGIGEATYGTNPKNNDTDGDKISDFTEVSGWKITVNSVERTVYSNPLKLDSDGEGLTDTQEFTLKKYDPMMKDTDGDGDSDLIDEYPELKDADGDGLYDDLEKAGYRIKVNAGTKLVKPNPNMADTDKDGLSDYEEYYAGSDTYITDPTKGDSDGDGLNDSQEYYSKKIEYPVRKIIPKGDNGEFRSFSISNVNFGTNFFDLKLYVSASSAETYDDGTVAPNGSFKAKLIVSGQSIELDSNTENNIKYYSKVFNLTDKISPSLAKGTWTLQIYSSLGAVLDHYIISGGVFLDPLDRDFDDDEIWDGAEISTEDGYETDPTISDTDNDGFSDHYEISHSFTNPLSEDTDGDKVIDSRDKNPLQDLYIKVTIDYAHWENAYRSLGFIGDDPKLQVVASCNGRSVATPAKTATQRNIVYEVGFSLYEIVDFNAWWNPFDDEWDWVWHVLFTWNVHRRTDYTGQSFTFDIDDSRSSIGLQVELWNVWIFNIGSRLFSKSISYTVGSYLEGDVTSGSDKVRLIIETKGLTRYNTVAVYNASSFYNNHYNQIQNYNVIALRSAAPVSTYGIVSGLNYIVIPSELFAETLLNKMVQKSTIDGTVDMSAFGIYQSLFQKFDFLGMDRSEASIALHLDSYYTTDYELTTSEINSLFATLLYSYNETIGKIYQATGLTDAEKLCLPIDILQIIPIDGLAFKNDETGDPNTPLPTTLWGAIVDLIESVINFIVWVVIELSKLIIWIIEKGLELLGKIVETVIKIIEGVIKAIILVIVYLLFAIDFIETLLMFVIAIAMLATIDAISDISLSFSLFDPFLFSFVIAGAALYYSIYYEFDYYIEFLDMKIPTKATILKINGIPLIHSKETFLFEYTEEIDDIYSYDADVEDDVMDLIDNLLEGASGSAATTKVTSSNLIDSPKLSNGLNIDNDIYAIEQNLQWGYPQSSQNSNSTPPTKPNLGTINSPSCDTPYTVYLNWGSVINATKLDIYRSETTSFADPSFTSLISLSGDSTYYYDSQDMSGGKELNHTYYYCVNASNSAGYTLSDWQSVFIPHILFEDSVSIISNMITFVVKSPSNKLKNFYVQCSIRGTGYDSPLNLESNLTDASGYYNYTGEIESHTNGPFNYYYQCETSSGNDIYLGDESNPFYSSEKIMAVHEDVTNQVVTTLKISDFTIGTALLGGASLTKGYIQTILTILGFVAQIAPQLIYGIPAIANTNEWTILGDLDLYSVLMGLLLFNFITTVIFAIIAINGTKILEKLDNLLGGGDGNYAAKVVRKDLMTALAMVLVSILTAVAISFVPWDVCIPVLFYFLFEGLELVMWEISTLLLLANFFIRPEGGGPDYPSAKTFRKMVGISAGIHFAFGMLNLVSLLLFLDNKKD